MTMTISRWALVAGLWCALASCSRTHSELGDSSTHWLKRCGSDDQCGSLSCLCGVCSTECGESRECRGLGAGAVCVAGAKSECGPAVAAPRVCDATCQRDDDCGSGLACVEARCRPAAVEPVPVSDAGSSSGSDAGESSMPDASGTQPPVSPGPLASACAPQHAASNGTLCGRSVGFTWNGEGCEEIVCGCAGDDCAAIQPTRAACEAAFASCRPTSVCSGLPWYQCFDHCPSRWLLQGGGRSFGECGGECSFELRFNPIAPAMGSCTEMAADLTIFNVDDRSQRVVNMVLTHEAWQQAALLSLALEGAMFEPVTACPDCATDTGQSWVTRSSGSDSQRYSYTRAVPPPGLQAYDRLIQQLIDQALECRGQLLHRCGSYSVEPRPRCGPGQLIADTVCECPVPSAQLSTLSGTPCSASCASCNPPGGGTCSAYCMQPCAGGEPAWSVSCTQ
jgi:hypothetical protein